VGELALVTQPSDVAQSGTSLGRQPALQLRDAAGNDVSQAGVAVEATIASGGGTLTVTAPQTNASGRAQFVGLIIRGLVGSRTLEFTAPGLSAVTSTSVDLQPGAPSRLVITTQPSDAAELGLPFTQQPVVQARDADGNDAGQPSVLVTATVATGTGSLLSAAPVSTNANGQATFTALAINGTGDHTLEFTAPALASDTSAPIAVVPGACTPTTPGDADGDRIPNCAETNTGVFVSLVDTGTDPNDPDTDGDGLPDGDEVLGTTAGLDLPAMGANPLRKDILMEYDWFNDALECAAHSHRPTAATVAMVTTAFANAPVLNPDGSMGITVINDYGQGGAFTGGNLIADADGVLTGGVNSAEFQSHKVANFAANRHGYFHYVILPHRYNTNDGSSGQAELPGDDMIVSLYCFNSDVNVGHTIMHELGHNLVLGHGGFESTNYKPNYNSVMNYKYQFAGGDNDCTPPGNGVLDYSRGTRITLVESNLNETLGICGNPPGPGWDWNGDGDALDIGIAVDINTDGANGDGILGTLQDFDDWAGLFLSLGLGDADGAFAGPREVVSCTAPVPPVGRP
jgi:hypothetical protein